MKKLIASISYLCYFVVSSGLIINSHYCMDRLASVHLFETAAETCGLCGMNTHESNGCCRDEVLVVKMEQDQDRMPVTVAAFAAPEKLPVVLSDYLYCRLQNVVVSNHFQNHSPPLLSEQETYLQIRVFRI